MNWSMQAIMWVVLAILAIVVILCIYRSIPDEDDEEILGSLQKPNVSLEELTNIVVSEIAGD